MIIENLVKGKLVKRYKRFFVDCILENGELITAHCPNSGSMKSLINEGNIVYLTHNNDPKRKLKYQLQIIELETGDFACVNTMLPNKIVFDAIKEKKIKKLSKFTKIKSEVKYGEENSRIDIMLTDEDNKNTYVEVKNVTLMEKELPKLAQFPDAVTSRGEKHLRELEKEVQNGNRAVMLYLVNRTDCNEFKIAEHIDKKYNNAFHKAIENGVEIIIIKTKIDIEDNKAVIEIDKEIFYNDKLETKQINH